MFFEGIGVIMLLFAALIAGFSVMLNTEITGFGCILIVLLCVGGAMLVGVRRNTKQLK